MRYYIATSVDRQDEAMTYSADIEAHAPDWTNTCAWWSLHDTKVNVLLDEMRGVRTADIVLALLPAGRGAHAEIGMAIAWGIPVLALSGFDVEPALIYSHPLVSVMRMPCDGSDLTAHMTSVVHRGRKTQGRTPPTNELLNELRRRCGE